MPDDHEIPVALFGHVEQRARDATRRAAAPGGACRVEPRLPSPVGALLGQCTAGTLELGLLLGDGTGDAPPS